MERATHARIASRYERHFQRCYIRGKLACDPVYAATAGIVAGTSLPLLDVGCGIGLLGQYLHAQGHRQPYLGVDRDARKITAGLHAVRRAGLEATMHLRHADANELPPACGHVVLLDMLHYLPADGQAALLESAVRHLAPQGCLVIRNVLREPSWRFHVTRGEEWLLRACGWMRGGAQHYPSAGEIRVPLETAGLAVSIEALRGYTPFNSYLVVARAR